MPKQIITSPDAPVTGFTDKATPSPLAQAIRAGSLLFVSGQGPLDPKTREVVSVDIREQTRQTLTNLKNILATAGLDFRHVVNMRVVLQTWALLPRYWANNCFDAVTMEYAREHLVRHQPRVLYIGLGETDEWGHGRRYDLYLESANNADRYLADLWKTLQSLPQYQDKTSLIVTTDHGRGDTRVDWTDHGKNVPLAEFIWIAVLGPDTPGLGVRAKVETTQSQVAATIAHLLGEDFEAASPKAAPPLPGVRGK